MGGNANNPEEILYSINFPAKRLEPTSGGLVLDGNLRVTYGDQFKPDLLDASSQLFLDKADKYQNMVITRLVIID